MNLIVVTIHASNGPLFVFFFLSLSCFSQQHLEDKHLSRFLEAEGIVNIVNQVDS